MGGRKVCFIDKEGQVGTCIRDDENCVHCSSYTTHYKWIKEGKKATDVDFYIRMYEQAHILEQTVYGLRDLASSLSRIGLVKTSDEMYWRAGNIEEVLEGIDKLLVDKLHNENEVLDYENKKLKEILKKMG